MAHFMLPEFPVLIDIPTPVIIPVADAVTAVKRAEVFEIATVFEATAGTVCVNTPVDVLENVTLESLAGILV
jgi:hypothetical protein